MRNGSPAPDALPNLVLIGAKKAGTTSLHHYLASHPDIWMAREKELDFFVAERNWSRGLDWYRGHFDAGTAVRGEASPSYTALPHHPGVPERMASVISAARLLYLVRDPIERLVSHYRMAIVNGRETRPLAAAVTNLAESPYVAQGRYWMQLNPYLRQFSPEQVLVVDQDELGRNRGAVLRRVFDYLGVDPDFVSRDFDEVHFPAIDRRPRRSIARATLVLDRALGKERSFKARTRVPARIRAMLTAPVERPDVGPALRSRLEELYAPDIARLREYTGQRFETWSV